MRRLLIVAAALALLCQGASSQSKSFKLGKWTEIENSVLRELNRFYVDTIPIDRIRRAAVDAMLAELDPYTIYVPREEDENFEMMIGKNYGGIGAVIYKPDINGPVIINEPYENSPAHKYGLRSGDEILEIDSKSTAGLTSQQASDRMRGTPGTSVLFKIRKVRSADTVEVRIVREKIHLPDIEFSGMLDDSTGYILQSGFTEGVGDEMRKCVSNLKKSGMKRLVLDLRGNGGGLMNEAVEIASIFLPKGTEIVSARGRDSQLDYTYKTTKEPLDTELPLVVLVDGYTASSSEIVSGALQDYDRALIAGRRSYGKGLVQSIRPLPYGGKMKITTAKYYLPSGRCVQAIDYSSPDEKGEFKAIPDSLTKEFKTASGRPVRDGSGITPDVVLKAKEYSRLTYSLVLNGVVERYALDFVRRHESIPAVEDFHFDDYDDFIAFARGENFDYRSSARTLYDQMVRELTKDGLEETVKPQLEALKEALEIDKEQFLRLMKDEIIPFIEEEIAVRYYFQKAGVKIRLRYDDQLRDALAIPVTALAK